MTKTTLLNTDDPLVRELLHLMAQVARQGREIEALRQELEALRRARPPVDAVSRQELP